MVINSFTNNFNIEGKINVDETNLKMKISQNCPMTTKSLTKTESVLIKYLPTIFSCQCFNDANNSFRDECKNTEIGHLFEHIMLEHLCIEKLADGNLNAEFEGRTSWEKDNTNVFYIKIKAGKKEIKTIQKAFTKSINLLEKIYN